MKKIFILFFLLMVLFVFGLFYIRERVGDIRPAILPTNNNLAQQLNALQKTGTKPDIPLQIPDGMSIGVFAQNLNGARDLQFSPQGTLLVSLPNSGRVAALPDKNNDGAADDSVTVVSNLNRPHGIAFFEGKLYVAEETTVSRYSFDENTHQATLERNLFDLPSGGRHRTRSITFDKKGNLYVSLGSTCDTCVEDHPFIGTVIVSDKEGKEPRVFSKGMRNAVFITIHPESGSIWATEMGRDFLGDDLPPDEVNILTIGGDFGWPFCYGDRIWDREFGQRNQIHCNTTIQPFYKIPAHSAPLGLTFINSPQMPKEWQGDLLVAYHGSWNRSTPSGYKIVRVKTDGTPRETDFITGFIQGSDAAGRPVDVEFDKAGSLFISDDKANAVYKLIKTP